MKTRHRIVIHKKGTKSNLTGYWHTFSTMWKRTNIHQIRQEQSGVLDWSTKTSHKFTEECILLNKHLENANYNSYKLQNQNIDTSFQLESHNQFPKEKKQEEEEKNLNCTIILFCNAYCTQTNDVTKEPTWSHSPSFSQKRFKEGKNWTSGTNQ